MSENQTITAEKSVICAMMQVPNRAITEAQDLGLRTDHFHFPAAGTLYGELVAMFEAQEPIELPSILVRLSERGLLENCGGQSNVAEIYTMGWAGNLGFYADAVLRAWATRQAIAACNGAVDAMLEAPDALRGSLDALRGKIDSIIQGSEQSIEPASHIKGVLGSVMDDLEERIEGKSLAELPSPWSKIRVGRGGLIVVGARPGMGKTAFLQNWMEHLALSGEPVCAISLEMDETELGYRTLATISGVPVGSYSNDELQNGAITKGHVQNMQGAIKQVSAAPLYIRHLPGGHRGDICQTMRAVNRRYGVETFSLDYLQLAEPMTKEDAISDKRRIDTTLRAVNAARKQLGATLILAVQLDRSADDKPAAHFPMSILADSSQTEKDADTIIFLGERTPERLNFWHGDEDTTDPRTAAMKKQRGRGTGAVDMEFVRNITTWRQC